ncbi:hypothetical protein [Robertmurraya massiliosenegalensis]|uniref:hypothetical protein n=1 Tax=Robertmurraya massiliosenegalensis TaxID=1287657 RepID=UPI0002DD18CD|nr:hypothetical protein [Robertmurraya massiliosenegalensis]
MKKAKLINKPKNKYPNLSNGESFLVSQTRLDKGTHVYFYNLDGTFKGCLPVDWFEIEKIVINDNSKNNESVEQEFKQLTLF